MKKIISVTVVLYFVCISVFAQQVKDPKIMGLLEKMTLEEKVGQMAQITLDVVGKGESRYSSYEPFQLDLEELRKAVVDYHVGSILNTYNNIAQTPEAWNVTIDKIQEVATEETRLQIPVIYGIDAIHGVNYTAGATLFPQQIAQSASRNKELVEQAAEITAYETRASNISWNFSPILDLGSDPRFSRIWEGFGEDPYLNSVLGKAIIDGYEGEDNDVSDPVKVAASLKHFLGYSVPYSGKDRTPAFISKQALYEYHVPSFKAAIEAGAHTVMINSGIINGIPVHSNPEILITLLRDELKFEGVAVSDWADIENLYERDHIAASHKEAIMIAVNAGVDMSMIAYNYERFCDNLVALVKEGKVSQRRIDEAVYRILKLKSDLGLFENPTTHLKDYPKFGSKEFEKVSYDLASEAITLLKNEGNILPLSKNLKVLVTGPNANSMRTLNGAWTYSWQGEKTERFAEKYNTILEAIQLKIGKKNTMYAPGVSYKMDGEYYEQFADRMDEAIKAAAKADVIILCLGENSYTETPGNLNDLYLSELQTELALKMAATSKPVILVLNEGRPRLISKFEPEMEGIIQTYLPGNFGGDALADILFGDVNPSGKLPYTYPRYPNALITYYHKHSEERSTMSGAYNYSADYYPQYEFGYGLSYTTFTYSNLHLDKKTLYPSGELTITVDVTNAGKREGKETVELYISDLVASITPDVKRLRGFEKVQLKSGETKTISFTISANDIAFYNLNAQKITEPGEFKVRIQNLEDSFMYIVD